VIAVHARLELVKQDQGAACRKCTSGEREFRFVLQVRRRELKGDVFLIFVLIYLILIRLIAFFFTLHEGGLLEEQADSLPKLVRVPRLAFLIRLHRENVFRC